MNHQNFIRIGGNMRRERVSGAPGGVSSPRAPGIGRETAVGGGFPGRGGTPRRFGRRGRRASAGTTRPRPAGSAVFSPQTRDSRGRVPAARERDPRRVLRFRGEFAAIPPRMHGAPVHHRGRPRCLSCAAVGFPGGFALFPSGRAIRRGAATRVARRAAVARGPVGPPNRGRFRGTEYGTVRTATVRCTVRYGTVRYGTVRYGTVRYGTVRCCTCTCTCTIPVPYLHRYRCRCSPKGHPLGIAQTTHKRAFCSKVLHQN